MHLIHVPLQVDAALEEKRSHYATILVDIQAVLQGEPDWVAAMATVSCILHHAFDYFHWTGFYCTAATNRLSTIAAPSRAAAAAAAAGQNQPKGQQGGAAGGEAAAAPGPGSQQEPELVVGPYQGSLGCLRIPYSRGVCGAAARSRQTQLVPDVHQFPGHIACASSTQSEVVVPVLSGDSSSCIAVLDVDSNHPAAFDEVDSEELQRLCGWLSSKYHGAA